MVEFFASQLVTKISVSDMITSKNFYENILSLTLDDRYTINSGDSYGPGSYMQFNYNVSSGMQLSLGLYKDIDEPFPVPPQTGTVPSFIVDDVYATLHLFLANDLIVLAMGDGKGDDRYVVKNTSDQGYTDLFFFFCDPDNNVLVIRQNL
jgi:catechol 2,3-dioxygenase-like lactoylglutathione lyase family enzyme